MASRPAKVQILARQALSAQAMATKGPRPKDPRPKDPRPKAHRPKSPRPLATPGGQPDSTALELAALEQTVAPSAEQFGNRTGSVARP